MAVSKATILVSAMQEFLERAVQEMEDWPDDTFIPALEYANELMSELEVIRRSEK